jgi:hydrogenase nickel incorporation protein HypA/HybF
MHESKLVSDILAKVDEIAAANGADRVETVRITIGALSHVTPDGFSGHFDLVARGTVAEGAHLDIIKSDDLDAPDALDVRLVSIVTGG